MRKALFFFVFTFALSSAACGSPAHQTAPPPPPPEAPQPTPLPTPPHEPSTDALTRISVDITGDNHGAECGTPGIEAPSTHYHADLDSKILMRELAVCESGSAVPRQTTTYRLLNAVEVGELRMLQAGMRLENITTCEANAPIQIVTTAWTSASNTISYPAEAAQSACEGDFEYASAPYRALLGRLEGLIADGGITEQ